MFLSPARTPPFFQLSTHITCSLCLLPQNLEKLGYTPEQCIQF